MAPMGGGGGRGGGGEGGGGEGDGGVVGGAFVLFVSGGRGSSCGLVLNEEEVPGVRSWRALGSFEAGGYADAFKMEWSNIAVTTMKRRRAILSFFLPFSNKPEEKPGSDFSVERWTSSPHAHSPATRDQSIHHRLVKASKTQQISQSTRTLIFSSFLKTLAHK